MQYMHAIYMQTTTRAVEVDHIKFFTVTFDEILHLNRQAYICLFGFAPKERNGMACLPRQDRKALQVAVTANVAVAKTSYKKRSMHTLDIADTMSSKIRHISDRTVQRQRGGSL